MSSISKPKAILFALITPVLLSACNTTPRTYDNENAEILTNLSPLATYFKDYLFNDCKEEQITLEYYEEILNKRESKAYASPYNADECIPISFNVHEPKDFYEDIIDSALDKDKARKVLDNLKMDGVDLKQVMKIDLKDGRLAQFVKFTPEKEADVQSMYAWRSRDMILDNWDDYFFLHELFHTTDINFDRTVPQNAKESLSDIATVVALSTTKEFTIDQSIELMEEVLHARFAETKNKFGSGYSTHYQEDMLYRFIDHLEGMKDNKELLRADSLGDAAKKARDIVLNINELQRTSFSASFYWSESEEIKKNSLVFDRSDHQHAKDQFLEKHRKKQQEESITLSAN